MITPGTRVVRDPIAGNIYFVFNSTPYYEKELKKRVKCGLGHQMWVNDMNMIICDHKKCQARIKCEDYEN